MATTPPETPAPSRGPALAERYASVKARVAAAARRAGADPRAIMLVAVTKNADPEQVRELIRLGHADFGESRVQQLLQRAAMIEEWLSRHRTLPGAPWSADPTGAAAPSRDGASVAAVRWHMIGSLQRNKAKKVIEVTRLIHSVDSLRLAEEIQAIAVKRDSPVDVLLQVNTSGEGSKGGCAPAAAIHLAEQVDTMVNVRLRGIMAMARYSPDPEDAREAFIRTRELFDEVREAGIAAASFNLLSMGMSGDFEVAIEEGSNLVRVGSAIFGDADPVDTSDEAPTPEDDDEA